MNLLALAFALALAVVPTFAACCEKTHCQASGQEGPACIVNPGWQCRFQTWGCCGVGACNIFCCNCDGGCLKDQKLLPESSPAEVVFRMPEQLPESTLCMSKFVQADRDGDELLTFREWLSTQSRPANLEAHAYWAKFDTEGKGYLTTQEAFERRAA